LLRVRPDRGHPHDPQRRRIRVARALRAVGLTGSPVCVVGHRRWGEHHDRRSVTHPGVDARDLGRRPLAARPELHSGPHLRSHPLSATPAPHGASVSHAGFRTASLDDCLWFHGPFRVDEWLLFARSPRRLRKSAVWSAARYFSMAVTSRPSCRKDRFDATNRRWKPTRLMAHGDSRDARSGST
jgi:hypothetical protein